MCSLGSLRGSDGASAPRAIEILLRCGVALSVPLEDASLHVPQTQCEAPYVCSLIRSLLSAALATPWARAGGQNKRRKRAGASHGSAAGTSIAVANAEAVADASASALRSGPSHETGAQSLPLMLGAGADGSALQVADPLGLLTPGRSLSQALKPGSRHPAAARSAVAVAVSVSIPDVAPGLMQLR